MFTATFSTLLVSDIGLLLLATVSFCLNVRAAVLLTDPLVKLRFGLTAVLSLIYAVSYGFFAFADPGGVSDVVRLLGWVTWFVVWWAPSMIAVRSERRRLSAAYRKRAEVLPDE